MTVYNKQTTSVGEMSAISQAIKLTSQNDTGHNLKYLFGKLIGFVPIKLIKLDIDLFNCSY